MNLLGYSVAAVLVALAAFFIVRKLRRPAANVAPLAPSPVDQNVQFTVYRPKAVAPNRWQTMLAFAHLSERRPDEPEQPDPIEEMERQAKTVLAAQTANYDQRTQDSGSAVPRGGWITFVPKISGVEFNPPKRTFQWTETVHREEFRLRASGDLVGRTLRGSMRVYLGALMLAEINLTLPVEVGASKAKPTTLAQSATCAISEKSSHRIRTTTSMSSSNMNRIWRYWATECFETGKICGPAKCGTIG